MNSKTIEKRFDVIRTILAVIIALMIALVVIVIVSDDPVNALYNFLRNVQQIPVSGAASIRI
ncbi:MAG: hypothetical protein HFI44_14735 [Lachnospiraceae bacterium]|jgi:ABC-type uncharacterized transport system permease subunit|nr:hypothetical protein [Lachnospiraceae bacterium]GFI03225.1 hypothetical protein IMSAGC005_02057 [Lachnospiraceae bacterium]